MNSGEAIEWCVDYLPEWPGNDADVRKLARPLGWKWGIQASGNMALDSGKQLIFEDYTVWSYKE